MNLSNEEIKLISDKLHENGATKVTIQNKDYPIKGDFAQEGKNQCRSVKIGSVDFMEQKLFKQGKTLNTEGAIQKRAGNQVVWGVRSDKPWVYIVNGIIIQR